MTSIHQKLDFLYDCLVDNLNSLELELTALIAHPNQIANTNKFASLLSELKNPTFIEPLLFSISNSEKEDPWLTDFLYAVVNLLEESSVSETFSIPPLLIKKLEDWILHNQGELAWKAASLLKFYESPQAEKIQLKKLEGKKDFFLTYAECILGLLRYDKNKHWKLIEQLSVDTTRDENLRKFAKQALLEEQ